MEHCPRSEVLWAMNWHKPLQSKDGDPLVWLPTSRYTAHVFLLAQTSCFWSIDSLPELCRCLVQFFCM